MDVNIFPADKEDVYELVDNIRDADRREIYALHGVSPLAGIYYSFKSTSDNYSVRAGDGALLCIWGFKRDAWNSHLVWMITTKAIEELKYARLFIKKCDAVCKQILNKYGYSHNVVHSKNATSIKWLKRLGAKFEHAIIIRDEEFFPFYFDDNRGDHNCVLWQQE